MTEPDSGRGPAEGRRDQSKLARSLSLVTAGSASGQFFLALSIPLVSRLYEPAEVGAFALALAFAQLAAIAVSGRIEQVLPRLGAGRRWQAFLTSASPMVVILPLVGGALALSGRISVHLALAMVVLTASISLYNIVCLCVLSVQRYRLVATMRFVNGLLTAVLQVAGGLVASTSDMLIYTYSAGNVVAIVLSIAILRQMRRARSAESTRVVFRDERLGVFALSVGGSALMSSLSLALPVIAFSSIYGAAVVGSFFLARKLIMIPTQLVATTVSEVSYSVIARQTPTEIREHVLRWMRRLWMAAGATLVVGAIAAPAAELLMGNGYEYLWQVVLMLTIAAATQLVATSLSNVLLALHAERLRFVWNVGRLAALAARSRRFGGFFRSTTWWPLRR